ncbi:MAG TPA: phytanoyl-CoA dioxygenase family protein [Myxococcota bacterium]|nr:phytanoyl-CoA dioxygenase family protein [Myxococcota bacterium]
MEIGDWPSTRDLNELYREIRARGLEPKLAELDAFGFTTIEGALGPDLVKRLRAAILQVAEERHGRRLDLDREQELSGVDFVPYLLFRDPAFEEVLLNPGPLALVTYLLGRSCVLSSLGSHVKGPGGRPLALHSDTANGAPAPFPPFSQVCNCNYALTDYREEAGALAVVPGSHRWARQPTRHELALDGPQRNPDAIALEVPAGTAIVWHGNTWHGSFARRVPGLRINLSAYFCRQNIQPQENYRDHVPAAALARHRDQPRFATLVGLDTHYGWTAEGPDWEKNARNRRAGTSWHA